MTNKVLISKDVVFAKKKQNGIGRTTKELEKNTLFIWKENTNMKNRHK